MIDGRTLLVTRIVRYVALAISGSIALATLFAFVPTLFGSQVLIVTSRSMEPWVEVGGIVVTKATPVSSVGVGDVITFRHEGAPATTHRIVEVVERGGGSATFITKGDANEDPDPNPITVSGSVAVAGMRVPVLGRVLAAVRTPFAALAFAMIGLSIVMLERHLAGMLRPPEPATV